MASENEIKQILPRVGELEKLVDNCCRDYFVWYSFIRIVQGERQGMTEVQIGRVISDWTENSMTGVIKKGEPFTVKFALPFDPNIYYQNRSDAANSSNYFDTSFMIKHAPPGKKSTFESCFFQNAVGQRYGITGTALGINVGGVEKTVPTGPTYRDESYPCEMNSISSPFEFMAHVATVTPVPYTTQDGYYKIYFDENNRLSIDIMRRDYMGNGENRAFFLTQWVMR